MDTSSEYIKMCEKAIDIQSHFIVPQLLSDRRIQITNEGDFIVIVNQYGTNFKIVWLPRQDQLQSMIIDKFTDCVSPISVLLLEFHFFVDNNVTSIFKSAEQYWLAFIMKEKYGKEWTEKEEWSMGWSKGGVRRKNSFS